MTSTITIDIKMDEADFAACEAFIDDASETYKEVTGKLYLAIQAKADLPALMTLTNEAHALSEAILSAQRAIDSGVISF